jgi:hypothetical protein
MLEQAITKPAKEFPITTSLVATAAILFTGSKLLKSPAKRAWNYLFKSSDAKPKQKKHRRKKSSKARAA